MKENHVFLARRRQGKSMAGKWEFPGGKIENDEDPKSALQRELVEELGMVVEVLEFLGENNHSYPDFSIQLSAFKCRYISSINLLNDHDAVEWVDPLRLKEYDLSEADLPFISLLI
jgi:8-oxo-dGTP diphosphatase